jgi:hypothetical protein
VADEADSAPGASDSRHHHRYRQSAALRSHAAVENRRGSADYGGPEIAKQQHAAYPDLSPALLPVPRPTAFALALQTAKEMGWDIVAADPEEGRIEASDTTFWFGFKDDVVVRIHANGGGSLIDVRSVSRVGTSDVGTNARRIRAYLRKLNEAGARS